MIKPTPKNQDAEKYMNELNRNTFLVIRRKDKVHGMFLSDSKLLRISADEERGNLKGMICIAKVVDVVKNIDAMFVRLPDKSKCFVPLSDCRQETNLSGDRIPVQGDNILLQVTKEAAKGKEASGTMAIKINGVYCVVTVGCGEVLFSHKISEKKRTELFEFSCKLKEKIPNNINVVLRTAVVELSDLSLCEKECMEKIIYLKDIFDKAQMRTEYSVLKQPLKNYQDLLLEVSKCSSLRIFAEDDALYSEVSSFVEENIPELRGDCLKYSDQLVSLGALFGVEKKLSEALSSKVWLDNGGFLYIEPTQAMTVIDVNSGKYDRNLTSEETYFQINLSAASEIVRQIALRNLSGIIIVDFISMKNKENNKKLLEKMSELFQNDTNSARIIDITKLGLVEITRKKTGKTIYEQILM